MTSIARTALTMASVLVAFFVVGCTSPGGTGSSAPGSSVTPASSTPGAGQASPVTASPSATRSGSGVLAVPKNLATSVKEWDKGRGGAALQAVSGQVGTALQATGLGQYTTARKACVSLATGVTAAQAGPPIPDLAMQHLYQKALTEIGQGATGCRTAIARHPNGSAYFKVQHDVAKLRQSTLVLSAGANDLYRATGEIKALERR